MACSHVCSRVSRPCAACVPISPLSRWVRLPQRPCRRSTSSRCCWSRCPACSSCSTRPDPPLSAARRGWWFGFGHHVLGLYWVTEAILFEAARFWWLVPLAVPAPGGGARASSSPPPASLARLARPGWPRVLALAGAWVLADLARQFVLTGFPWNPWGSVWAIPGPVGDVFIQPAAWIGVHGLTLATLLLAGAPMLGWRWRVGGAVLLAAWVAVGVVRLAAGHPAAAADCRAGAGQRRAGPEVRPGPRRADIPALPGPDSRRRGYPGRPWWSGPRPPSLACSMPTNRRGGRSRGRPEAFPALIGSVRFDARQRPRNSLFAVLRRRRIGRRLRQVASGAIRRIHPGLAAAADHGDARQAASPPAPDRARCMSPGLPPFGPLICYEAIFPGEIVDRNDRPGWLVNVTNDAWFGNSTGPRQHLAAARMRAVEEGLPLRARGQYRHLRRVRRAWARTRQDRHAGHRHVGRGIARSACRRRVFARFGLWLPAISGSVALGVGLMARRIAASRLTADPAVRHKSPADRTGIIYP